MTLTHQEEIEIDFLNRYEFTIEEKLEFDKWFDNKTDSVQELLI